MRRIIMPALTIMIIAFAINPKSTLENTIDALYFVFMDFNEVESIISLSELDLTEEQREGITSLAYANHEENKQYYEIYVQKNKSYVSKKEYDENILKSQKKLIDDLQTLLGDKYDDFETWFNTLWKTNKYKVPSNSLSD